MASSWTHASALAVSRDDSSISEQVRYSCACATFVSHSAKFFFFVSCNALRRENSISLCSAKSSPYFMTQFYRRVTLACCVGTREKGKGFS